MKIIICILQYLAQVLGWRHACESASIPSSIEDLEEALQQHQALIETISQGYAEVGVLHNLNNNTKPSLKLSVKVMLR